MAPLASVTGAGRRSPTVVRVQLPLAPESAAGTRALVGTLLDHVGVDDRSRADIVLAVSEAASNAVEYGTGSHFDVCIEVGDGRCLVTVSNTVDARDATVGALASGTHDTAMPEPLADRGRGLAIMEIVMDEISIDLVGDQCVVQMLRLIGR